MQDMDYVQGHGADLHRRSLYTFWKRTVAPPFMMRLSTRPIARPAVVRESRTNTSRLQALNLMNDVTPSLKPAAPWAMRMIHEGGSTDAARLR